MENGNSFFWLGFWIFLSVFVMCDTYLFGKGYDTFLQTHKTELEKKIQDKEINR